MARKLLNKSRIGWFLVLGVATAVGAARSRAQEPAVESGRVVSPGTFGISYSSNFITKDAPEFTVPVVSLRPTFEHEARFLIEWGFRKNFAVSFLLPIETLSFHYREVPDITNGGTGLGDAMLVGKYQFLHKEYDGGSASASFTFGPKLSTGRTELHGGVGQLLPPGLQPGSGSTDVYFGANGTYTGLFQKERLALDGSISYTKRSEGTQQFRFGDTFQGRLWLSYHPEAHATLVKSWWIGPSLRWTHSAHDAQFGNDLSGTAGGGLYVGGAMYLRPYDGIMLWLGGDLPLTQTDNGIYFRTDHLITFGITKEFQIKHW
jgi:hypothetical protein